MGFFSLKIMPLRYPSRFLNILGICSLLLLGSILWVYCRLVTHSSVAVHFGCFQLLAFMNKAAMNTHIHKISFFWDKCPGAQLLSRVPFVLTILLIELIYGGVCFVFCLLYFIPYTFFPAMYEI